MKWPINNTFFYCENHDYVSWQQQVVAHARVFEAHNEKTWLLFDVDTYQFSVLFFALLVAKKSIVLPQNGQPEQLAQCLEYADAFTGDAQLMQAKVTYTPSLKEVTDTELDIDEKTAIRFFTSGSSGSPKAIDKTFEQLLLEIIALEAQFSEQVSDSVFVATVSHQHIYGILYTVLWPLYAGHDVCLKSFDYPENLLHFVQNNSSKKNNEKYTLISSPAYYHRLVQDNVLVEVKDKLHAFFSSGGPLQSFAAQLLTAQFGDAPIEVLGSTETGGIAWRKQNNSSVWQVFSTIKLKLDELQRLIISSPYVANGDWYQTDDRAELIGVGEFNLLGRADRIVKIEEKRCSLDEITQRINQHAWVADCYVLLLNNINKRAETAAVLVLSEAGRESLTRLGKFKFSQALKGHLKAFFEPLVIPRKYRYLDQLPYNTQGKLNKAQLEAMFD